MAKKGKTYRGQRHPYNPCGCFFCTGYDKEDLYYIEEKEALKEVNEIINNVCLHNVSNSLCNSETYFDEDENETYCKECGKCI